jgi:hypothetical protein
VIKKIAKSQPEDHDPPFPPRAWTGRPSSWWLRGIAGDISHEGLRVLLGQSTEFCCHLSYTRNPCASQSSNLMSHAGLGPAMRLTQHRAGRSGVARQMRRASPRRRLVIMLTEVVTLSG